MSNAFLARVNAHRERIACALAAALLVLACAATVRGWRAIDTRVARGGPGRPVGSMPAAAPLDQPLDHYWTRGGRSPFLPAGQQPAPPTPTDIPFPPLPPLGHPAPPPADPAPCLYRGPARPGQPHLLTLAFAPRPPPLKDGRPCTVEARPHDIVQAPGDPKPLEGTVRRDKDGNVIVKDGTVSFYFVKPRGVGHPRNPLAIADLLVYKLRAPTVGDVFAERVREAGDDPNALLALAQDCLNGDLSALAQQALEAAVRLDPRHHAGWLKLADLHAGQGRRDAEVGACRAAVEADPGFAEARARLAQRCLELGLLGLAHDHFARAFQAATGAAPAAVAHGNVPPPDRPQARGYLRQAAEAHLAAGRLDEATRLLDRLAGHSPDDAAVLHARALAHLLAGRGPEALAALRTLAARPEPPPCVLNNLGAALFAAGDHAAALERFDACRAAAPGHTKAALNAILALAATGRLADADTLLAQLPKPPAPTLHRLLVAGYVHERQRRFGDAAAAYRGALALDRACVEALCGLGRAHLAQGDAGAATEPFRQALLVRPGHPDVLRAAGACHARAGRAAEAVRVFERLVELPAATRGDSVRLAVAACRQPRRRRDAAALLDRVLRDAAPPAAACALAARAFLVALEGAEGRQRAQALFRKVLEAGDGETAKEYAKRAIAAILAARREDSLTYGFKGERAAVLPEGWQAVGTGPPAPLIENDALRFQGRAVAVNERQVFRTVPLRTPAGPAAARALARIEAAVRVPYTNQADVGLFLALGSRTSFQAALRTKLRPEPTRHVAWRVVRDGRAGDWHDLPGAVALEEFRLGIAIADLTLGRLNVLLDGKAIGTGIGLPELLQRRKAVSVGLFVATQPRQECLYTIREVHLVWRKATPAIEP